MVLMYHIVLVVLVTSYTARRSPTMQCISTGWDGTAGWLVCGSRGTCLDCTLLGVQVTTGLGFFLCSSHLVCEDSDPCSTGFGLLAGP